MGLQDFVVKEPSAQMFQDHIIVIVPQDLLVTPLDSVKTLMNVLESSDHTVSVVMAVSAQTLSDHTLVLVNLVTLETLLNPV